MLPEVGLLWPTDNNCWCRHHSKVYTSGVPGECSGSTTPDFLCPTQPAGTHEKGQAEESRPLPPASWRGHQVSEVDTPPSAGICSRWPCSRHTPVPICQASGQELQATPTENSPLAPWCQYPGGVYTQHPVYDTGRGLIKIGAALGSTSTWAINPLSFPGSSWNRLGNWSFMEAASAKTWCTWCCHASSFQFRRRSLNQLRPNNSGHFPGVTSTGWRQVWPSSLTFTSASPLGIITSPVKVHNFTGNG